MWFVFFVAWIILSAAAVLHLLLNKREPVVTLAWLFFTVGVPIFGPLIFLIFGPERLERKAVKRKRAIAEMLALVSDARARSEGDLPEEEAQIAPEQTQVLRLVEKVSEYGVTVGNEVELLGDPQETLAQMHAAIDAARHFVHLEYYVIASDEVTRQIFTSLEKAAQRGVEVRILYDAIGSLFLKRIAFKRLLQHGAKVAGFLPFSLLPQRGHFNFRNHRKILVVDGQVAFTGGMNIGREYLGRRSDKQWRDYSVKVQGPVCLQLQDVFAKDWHFTTQEELFDERYYPKPAARGNAAVQVLESGPDSEFHLMHQAIFLAINMAREEILLTTAYFIPDPAMLAALTVAALRGVAVTLLLPQKSDAPIVQLAGRSFYDSLLQAGVKIWEYQPRILHSKLMTIDGKWTIAGSANMDARSFRYNFELNLMVYGTELAGQVAVQLSKDLAQSKEITLEALARRSLWRRLAENAARVFSPIF